MTRKKKKKLSKGLLSLFEKDAGKGFENFDKPPTRINVFDRARKIKTWNMFIHLVEQENIPPADALTIILKHLSKSTSGDDLTEFRAKFGGKRKKKKVPHFIDKEFKI